MLLDSAAVDLVHSTTGQIEQAQLHSMTAIVRLIKKLFILVAGRNIYDNSYFSVACRNHNFFHTVDALILECTKEISGNQGNQLIIDCSTNREPNATYCAFDGNSRQECEELYFMPWYSL